MKPASKRDIALSLLRGIPLFADLDTSELSDLQQHLSLHRPSRREVFFQEGTRGSECYFIAQGFLALFKGYNTERQICVELAVTGEPVGIPAVLDGIDFPLTLVALYDSVIASFPKECFLKFLADHRKIEQDLSFFTRERFRHAQTRFQEFATGSAKQKILSTLSLIVERFHIKEYPAEISLNKKELAELSSVEPETMIRLSRDLESSDLLRSPHRGVLTLLRPPI